MAKVLITGGARGIGFACVQQFLQHGHEVIALDRDFTDVELDDKVKAFDFDLTRIEDIKHLPEQVGEIDILINNAGIIHCVNYDDYTEDQKKMLMAINIEAPVALISAFAPHMLKQKKGRVVNVGSTAGLYGSPDVWYGISKAGLHNVTQSFARLLGPQGIVVNAVAPGASETNLLNCVPKERQEATKQSSFLKRLVTPEEVATTIYWLAVDAPEYINGEVLPVRNGIPPR